MGDEQGRSMAGTKRLLTILGMALALVLMILQMDFEDSSRRPDGPKAMSDAAAGPSVPGTGELLAPKPKAHEPPPGLALVTLHEDTAERKSLGSDADERDLLVNVRDARGKLVNDVIVELFVHSASGWQLMDGNQVRVTGREARSSRPSFLSLWRPGPRGLAKWEANSGKLRQCWSDWDAAPANAKPRLAVGVFMPGRSYASLPARQRQELEFENWPTQAIELQLDEEALATLVPIRVQVYFADGKPAPHVPLGLYAKPVLKDIGKRRFLCTKLSDAKGQAQISLADLVDKLEQLREDGFGMSKIVEHFELSIAASIPSILLIEAPLPRGLNPGQEVRLDLPPIARVRATFWDSQGRSYGGDKDKVSFKVSWYMGTGRSPSKGRSSHSGLTDKSSVDLGWVGMGVGCRGSAYLGDGSVPPSRLNLPALQSSEDLELRFEFGETHLQLAWLVLDENGEVLLNTRLRYAERDRDMNPEPRSRQRRRWKNAKTDAEGRFLHIMRSNLRIPRVIELRYGSGDATTWATSPLPDRIPPRPRPKTPGATSIVNMGQFHLSREPLVEFPQPIKPVEIFGAEGVVVDRYGVPIIGVLVRAHAIAKGRSGFLGTARTFGDGRFDLNLNFSEPFRLTLSNKNYIDLDEWPVRKIQPGTTGLKYVMQPGLGLQVSLANFELPLGKHFEVRGSNQNASFGSEVAFIGEARGIYAFKKLPAGPMDVGLYALGTGIELARIKGVELRPDLEDVDPRLVDIDFKALAYARWYTFETPNGDRLKDADLRMTVPGYPEAKNRQDTNGTAVLFAILPRDVQFVTFYVEGIGSAVVPMGDEDVTVRLVAGG